MRGWGAFPAGGGNPMPTRTRVGVVLALVCLLSLSVLASARTVSRARAARRAAPDDPDLLHTTGTIDERLHRFREAATAFEADLQRAGR
jgi:hypothetical protein